MRREERNMLNALSAVQAVARTGVTKHLFSRLIVSSQKKRNMSDWKTEKIKYLNMDVEERRKFLNASGRRYQTIDNIPTWTEYYMNKQPLPRKIDILGGFQIDESKNKILAKKVSIFAGDITTLEVDAIVNAANSSLAGGGGVDGAIHRCAGPELKAECLTLNGCKTGAAKMTGAYRLPAKHVIHTVGPQREKPDILTMCYKNSLDLMLSNDLRTIAFPCISTGVYGYPINNAVHVSNRQVREFLEKHHEKIDRIIFCLFGLEDIDIYEKALQSYFPIREQ